MIINLFSLFDPSTSWHLNLNWLRITIPILILPWFYWIIPSRTQILANLMEKYIKSEVITNLKPSNYKTIILFIALFLFIIWNNLLGLYPYNFAARSHPLITITITLPIWFTFILYGWINNTKHILKHLVPTGTPLLLSTFIVLIETTSNLIRPLTLSIRLAANIIAGHLLLSLLSRASETKPIIFLPSFLIIIILLLLETSVALIQSYVFITLISLYLRETS